MSWMCENCGRSFRTENQYHSCFVMPPEVHFENKPELFYKTWISLVEFARKLGPVEIIAVKNFLFIRIRSNFISVKPRKSGLIAEFFLDKECEFPFIHSRLRHSKNRIAHGILLTKPSDITPGLKKLLKESYKLMDKT